MKKKIVVFSLLVCLLLSVCGCNKSNKSTTFEICNDSSNAVRALTLLANKGIISQDEEGDNWPISKDENGDEYLNLSDSVNTWENKAKTVKITLVEESLLVASMADYDYALLPCNTAYTGNVSSDKQVGKEDDPEQVALKANIIACRKDDYNNNAAYKQKIDALTNAMLSDEVADYFNTTYLGAMTCDASSQIDMRDNKDVTVNGNGTVIEVCASDVPHAQVLNGVVKDLLAKDGYTLKVTILDWTLQNDEVAAGTYDANYFQHVPYLNTYAGTVALMASCKVHYEPLGIYSNTHSASDFAALAK